ncbi:hypothetical protein [Halopiger djelfimassiliensis]|uniref:hypothetical protein n=1 Tax=Halopiger djelfimassiliensis TaxID=1293047 RepID=UPI000677C5E3|nr:hypothetical protein [Halopiger djelfimassiliensis]
MPRPDLRTFVARSRALIESSPPTDMRETRAWLVDPFLETLGWDVHADSYPSEPTVEGTRLEYVLGVDTVPALFVAVEPYGTSLDRSRATGLLEAMAWTGVDRAIYTNGREFLLLAGTTDADRVACRLPSLPDHETSIGHYSRATVGQRLECHSRPFVARQLALERGTLVDSIVEQLTAVSDGGDVYVDEFESAADRFLDRLIVSFAGDDGQRVAGRDDVSFAFTESEITDENTAGRKDAPDSTHRHGSGPERSGRDGNGGSTAEAAETDSRTGSGQRDTDHDGTTDTHATDTDHDADADRDETGEYVVRFFNERGSIGAIGHSSSRKALVHAVEYLLDRGLSGVTLPWNPDDGPTVLNDDPVAADGSPMTAPEQLSNGYYLETGGDAAAHAARIEALSSRAGLRAMVTGDWE